MERVDEEEESYDSDSLEGSPLEAPRSGSPPREELASPLPLLPQRLRGASPPRRAPACGSTRLLLARAEAACAAARGAAAAALPRLPLSQALARGLGTVSGRRAAFVQCHVTALDAPPPGALDCVQTLLLSRNALRTLLGAPTALLRPLTALSVAHNCLDDVGTFALLAAGCPALTALSVEGNPLCELMDARAHAIAALPLCRSVDGREVAPEERRAAVLAVRAGSARGARARPIRRLLTAPRALRAPRVAPARPQVRREEAVLEAALARACVAAALEACAAWRGVHAAIRRGGALGADTPAPQRRRRGATRRLVAMWDYQARPAPPWQRARTHAPRPPLRVAHAPPPLRAGQPVPRGALRAAARAALRAVPTGAGRARRCRGRAPRGAGGRNC
jgi:hypothetical protein